MKTNILKFSKAAVSTSALLGVGLGVLAIAIIVPAIAMSFTPMALWKSPETVPGVSPTSIAYDTEGTPSGQGNLIVNAPIIKELGAENLKNYNAWVKIINEAVVGTSASPSLVLAILYKEHGKTFPPPTGECTAGKDCVEPKICNQQWCVSTSYAYGPFQFLNGTWWGYGMTTEEKTAITNANGKAGNTLWWDFPDYEDKHAALVKAHPGMKINDPKTPVSDTVFDPVRAAKGAAKNLGANMDAHEGTLSRKITMAITLYNSDPSYLTDVYSSYLKFASCLDSSGSVDEPDLAGDMPSKIVTIAKKELGLKGDPSIKPPDGYHTKNESNCVKYLNSSVNDVTTVNCKAWCAAFANWVYRKAGYDFPATASNGEIINFFSKNGHTFKFRSEIVNAARDIKAGDIILMNSESSSSGYHAGIVKEVSSTGVVTTIEGNLGRGTVDKVGTHPRTMSDKVTICTEYNSKTRISSNCIKHEEINLIYAIARW